MKTRKVFKLRSAELGMSDVFPNETKEEVLKELEVKLEGLIDRYKDPDDPFNTQSLKYWAWHYKKCYVVEVVTVEQEYKNSSTVSDLVSSTVIENVKEVKF